MDKKRENSRIKKALASITAMKHGRPGKKLNLIVIAGEYGKTTTAQLLRGVLIEAGKKVAEMTASRFDEADFQNDLRALQKNLNLALKQNVDYVILEVNPAFIESGALDTIQIDTLVITSHCEGIDKLLSENYRRVVIPHGFEAQGVPPHHQVTFGFDEKADMSIRDAKLYRKGIELQIVIDQHEEVQIASFLVGRSNAENIAAALAAAYVIGVKVGYFAEGIAKLEQVPGNFQYIEPVTKKDYLIAVEAGLTEESIAKAIAAAHDVTKRRILLAVAAPTSDTKLKEYKKYADRLVYVGQTEAHGVTQAADAEEAAIVVLRAARKDDLILLVGREFLKENQEDKTVAQSVVEKMTT